MYTETHIYIAAAIYRSGKRHKPGFVHSTAKRMHTRKSSGREVKQVKNRGLHFYKLTAMKCTEAKKYKGFKENYLNS